MHGPQADYQKRVDPKNAQQQALLQEMQAHIKKVCSAQLISSCNSSNTSGSESSPWQLEEMRKNEDPRLSFSTPEFKEAQRSFTEGFKASCTQVHALQSGP